MGILVKKPEEPLSFHKKVMIFLGLACLFITFIMVSFLFQGVTPKVPKMVKWSSVKSPEKAGDRLAAFLFPLLKNSEKINIWGDSGFSKLFFESFLKRTGKEGIKTEIQRITEKTYGKYEPGFSIFIFQLKGYNLNSFCKGKKPSSFYFPPGDNGTFSLRVCRLGEKALSQFHKKKRDLSFYWITMDRLEEDKAVLFFQPVLKNKRN